MSKDEKDMTMTNNKHECEENNRKQPHQQSQQMATSKKTPKDFIFGRILGEGSFSSVYLAKDVNSEKQFAIKVCDKRHILREKKSAYVKREKEVLTKLNASPSPFFVKLYCTFQDTDRLYFVLSYAKNGELLPYIQKVGSFDVQTTQFYSGEIILALEHLHSLNIIHRDLKPENILLDEDMHIKITDFGSTKILEPNSEAEGTTRRNSFVGTAQYVSPELLNNKSCSKSSDLWALGCIIYQFHSGRPPFRASNEYLIFQKVVKLEYEFPEGFTEKCKDLVQKLLVLEADKRLGCDELGSFDALKAHTFYEGLEWMDLHTQTPPRILPYLPGTSSNEELRSTYTVADDLQPGLDDTQLTRLLGLGLHDLASSQAPAPQESNWSSTASFERGTHMLDLSLAERKQRLEQQTAANPYHKFVENNLVLKQGLIDKRVGLFARRRMLLLTEGPHLYYVDPVNMVLKGQIPMSAELRPEPKNFKIFFVHTPNRTYYLEDPEGYALEWCKAIEQVRKETYGCHQNDVPTT